MSRPIWIWKSQLIKQSGERGFEPSLWITPTTYESKYAISVLGPISVPPFHYISIPNMKADLVYRVLIHLPYRISVLKQYDMVRCIMYGLVWYDTVCLAPLAVSKSIALVHVAISPHSLLKMEICLCDVIWKFVHYILLFIFYLLYYSLYIYNKFLWFHSWKLKGRFMNLWA